MPTYRLICQECGHEDDLFAFCTISEFEKCKTEDGYFDTAKIDLTCPKCSHSVFKKLPSPHGNNSANWSKWSKR